MRWLRCWTTPVLAACLMVAAGDLTRGEEKKSEPPLDREKQNKVIHESLRGVINRGADLFNGGDWNGCYRLYEGALLGVEPLLDHRPALQKTIKDALAEAERNPSVPEKAFVLRRAIDTVRKELGGTSAGTVDNPKTTLWERLGGEKGVKLVVDDFVGLAAADPKVNFFRDEKTKKAYEDDPKKVDVLKEHLVDFISMATKGPRQYTGKSMKDVHKGMAITDEEFDAARADLKKALEKNGVKDPELKQVLDAVEGTRADVVAPKGEVVKPKTLWERLGGEKGVKLVVDDFVAEAATDPKVNFFRDDKLKKDYEDPDKVKALKEHLVDFISMATNGPRQYTGKSMKEVHKGMHITDEEFNAAKADLEKALKKNGVKDLELKQVLDAVEGTRKDIVESKEAKLWDRLGGDAGVKLVVDDFVDRAAKDDKANFFRSEDKRKAFLADEKKVKALKNGLVEFISDKTGGPHKYKGPSMKELHKGMGITDEEFNALADDLKAALEKNKVKAEDITLVMTAVEGTRKDIVEKSPEGRPEAEQPAEKGDVTGKVSFQGKPLTEGTVAFVPEKGNAVSGKIGADGTYKVANVPAGSYVVVITDTKGALPASYGDAKTSKLKVEVKKGANTADLELK